MVPMWVVSDHVRELEANSPSKLKVTLPLRLLGNCQPAGDNAVIKKGNLLPCPRGFWGLGRKGGKPAEIQTLTEPCLCAPGRLSSNISAPTSPPRGLAAPIDLGCGFLRLSHRTVRTRFLVCSSTFLSFGRNGADHKKHSDCSMEERMHGGGQLIRLVCLISQHVYAF